MLGEEYQRFLRLGTENLRVAGRLRSTGCSPASGDGSDELVRRFLAEDEAESVTLTTMPLFQHLLVPHDFSPHSDRALQAAIGLAKQTGARIRLLHIFESPQATFEPYGILPLEPHLIEVPQSARERLQQELDRVLEAGLEGEAFVREGRAVESILAEIASSGADLVVMGSHGWTGVAHALLGSVAERIIRLSPTPVLTVKESSPA